MPIETLHRTCIVCPRGCPIEITIDGESILVEGHQCSRGEDYGLEEAIAPRRVLTTTVRTTSLRQPRLPVRSVDTVLLADMIGLMAEIDSIVVSAPIRCGQVVASNLGGRGVDLRATDDLPDELAGTTNES